MILYKYFSYHFDINCFVNKRFNRSPLKSYCNNYSALNCFAIKILVK